MEKPISEKIVNIFGKIIIDLHQYFSRDPDAKLELKDSFKKQILERDQLKEKLIPFDEIKRKYL